LSGKKLAVLPTLVFFARKKEKTRQFKEICSYNKSRSGATSEPTATRVKNSHLGSILHLE
jgi:hypothetical protein